MTSAPPNALTSGGKSLNSSSSHSPLQQYQAQVTSPGFDSSSRRSSHQSSPIHTSARNNQSRKKQHKNSTKPRLANEDEMAESVRNICLPLLAVANNEKGAMRNANSRRGQTSITHLMNFTLPPRPQDYRNTIARVTRRGNIYGIGSGHHSSDKARCVVIDLPN